MGANGLKESTHPVVSSLPVAAKLALLLQSKENWRRLEWRKREWVNIPGECFAYELVGGWFAKCRGLPDVVGEGGEIVGGSREFVFCRLPRPALNLSTDLKEIKSMGVMGGLEAKAIIRQDIGIPCRDFNFDPTQDLLALVEEPGW